MTEKGDKANKTSHHPRDADLGCIAPDFKPDFMRQDPVVVVPDSSFKVTLQKS